MEQQKPVRASKVMRDIQKALIEVTDALENIETTNLGLLKENRLLHSLVIECEYTGDNESIAKAIQDIKNAGSETKI